MHKQSNKKSGTRLKTESETGEICLQYELTEWKTDSRFFLSASLTLQACEACMLCKCETLKLPLRKKANCLAVYKQVG